ncbi:MAG TPA: hypothetical protein VFA55_01875 [Candidatus Kapabacteria bacterium]|nr:hypothetical protein [Candidatus Kapabacteria bacterium]
MRLIPPKRFFINLELALILGLCEGAMFNIVLRLNYTRYQKVGLLMLGTAGVFSLVTAIVRPLAEKTLKTVARAEEGSALSRLVIHAMIIAGLFFGYLKVYF